MVPTTVLVDVRNADERGPLFEQALHLPRTHGVANTGVGFAVESTPGPTLEREPLFDGDLLCVYFYTLFEVGAYPQGTELSKALPSPPPAVRAMAEDNADSFHFARE